MSQPVSAHGDNIAEGLACWKYYFHSMIPSTPPHIPQILTKEIKKALFKKNPKAFMIRWYSDYDCSGQTQWWYEIKDSTYNPDELKAKRRYEITKGRRYFDTKIISSREYKDEISNVWIQSMRGYSERDRKSFSAAKLSEQVAAWDEAEHLSVFGAFDRETSQLCGFSLIARQGLAIHISSLKTIPEFEKFGLNAALVDGILLEYNHLIEEGFYICDGSRNVLHETRFQDYLEKYFGFRKAYCRLHVCYRGLFPVIIAMLYVIRGPLKKLDNISIIHKINGVLRQEEFKEDYTLR